MKRKSKSEPKSESESESGSSSPGSSSEEEEEEEVEESEEESDVSESESESESEESESEDEASKKPSSKKRNRTRDGKEEVIDPTDRDAIRRLVEPFSKEQLMTLLTEAALKNPSVMSTISSSAQSDPEHRKIFVHGLNFDTTSEDLRQAFTPFGPIEEVVMSF
jgi:heterogeneous nuclear ribonucleoprotein A1/A3